MKPTPPRRTAFTLSEILIVLAIIGILAAVLFTVFGRVRERGNSTVCQANLHQLYLAAQMYIGDANGRYPTSARQLLPYVPNHDSLKCPSAGDLGMLEAYVVAGWVADHDYLPSGQIVRGALETDVPHQTVVPLFVESSASSVEVTNSCFTRPSTVFVPHLNGTNLCFCDGHVKWMSASAAAQFICDNADKMPFQFN